jgi:hypothetical protein
MNYDDAIAHIRGLLGKRVVVIINPTHGITGDAQFQGVLGSTRPYAVGDDGPLPDMFKVGYGHILLSGMDFESAQVDENGWIFIECASMTIGIGSPSGR